MADPIQCSKTKEEIKYESICEKKAEKKYPGQINKVPKEYIICCCYCFYQKKHKTTTNKTNFLGNILTSK